MAMDLPMPTLFGSTAAAMAGVALLVARHWHATKARGACPPLPPPCPAVAEAGRRT